MKPCPKCSKVMVCVGTGIVLGSYPQQYPMIWWCACDHTEDAGIDRGMVREQMNLEAWGKINAEWIRKDCD